MEKIMSHTIHYLRHLRFSWDKLPYLLCIFILFFALFLLLDTHSILIDHSVLNQETAKKQARFFENYGKLPLYFEPNKGQIDHQVNFLSRGKNFTLFLTPDEAVLSLSKNTLNKSTNIFNKQTTGHKNLQSDHPASRMLRMKYLEANTNTKVTGLDEQRAKSNYFTGNNPDNWHTDIPNYAKVKYENIYDGIDLVYYGNQGYLEFDYIVAPRVNHNVIRFSIEGTNDILLDDEYRLHVCYDDEEVVIGKPHIYQKVGTHKKKINGRYRLSGNIVSFEVEDYDPQLSLVIDPVLVYSTYLGGSDFEFSKGIAVDAAGNAYVGGTTESIDFPMSNPLQNDIAYKNAFVSKISADGSTLIYSTYIGGDSLDWAEDIAIDDMGNAYLTGLTQSDNFPTANAFQSSLAIRRDTTKIGDSLYVKITPTDDVFITKLSTDGTSLVYSTYLGGTGHEGGRGIAVDASGNAYVTGETGSEDFPTSNPFQGTRSPTYYDTFVTKLAADGSSLVYSTYLGGSNHESIPYNPIAVDFSGNAVVIGHTQSDDFPLVNPIQNTNKGGTGEAFIVKFRPDGSPIFSTYFGGSDWDDAHGVALDEAGHTYITGETWSTDFPLVNAFQNTRSANNDAFVTKLNPDGSAFIYSTLLGGNSGDHGGDIAADGEGNAYIVGTTYSTDFPIVNGFQSTPGGLMDLFVARFNSYGSDLTYSTYLGGSDNEGRGKGMLSFGIALDAENNMYVSSSTTSDDLPVTKGAFQQNYAGNEDAFIAKISTKGHIYIIYDQVVNGGPPVFSRQPLTPQQILPQYLLNSVQDTIVFIFEGRSTDGMVGLRVINTRVHGINATPLNLNTIILDPDTSEITPFTIPLIGTGNVGKQFGVSKNGLYTVKVFAGQSSPGPFPAPFQIHLAGNVGHPRKIVNDQPETPRATRQDILFNHPAPRPQGIYGRQDTTAQTALFKFANPVEVSQFVNAVIIPQTVIGVPANSTIVRARDPVIPLNITTPTARTPDCGAPQPGIIIDFTQVPDPKEAGDQTTVNGSVCAVIGANDGSTVTLPLPLANGTSSTSLILDMGSGQEIVNGEGYDLRVHASSGSYTVAISNTPYAGTFQTISGVVSESQSFDLTATGLTSARYVLITASPNVTIDAVQALNILIDHVIQDPVAGSQIMVGDVNTATITTRRSKAAETAIDPILDLIGPDGSRFGQDGAGFGDPTSKVYTDAALISIDLVQESFYRFLVRGPYDGIEAEQSFGSFFVRLESGGSFDHSIINVSDQNEEATTPQKTGVINQPRQRDSYLFVQKPGESIKIVVNALDESFDPMVELYDPEGFLIGANDNFEGRDGNSVLVATLPNSNFIGTAFPDILQTYRIVVSAIDPKRGDSSSDWVGLTDGRAYFRGAAGGSYELKVFKGTLAPKPPNITSILPNGIIQGATDEEIIINGSLFGEGTTVSFNHSGIVVTSVTFLNSSQLKIKVNVAATVPVGWYDVTVTNPDGLEKTMSEYLEVRSNFGVVNLRWNPPSSGETLAPPTNLSAQISGQQTMSKTRYIFPKQNRSLSKINSFSSAKQVRNKTNPDNFSDIIDEIEPNNSFDQAQMLSGDSIIFVDGFAETADSGSVVFAYAEGEDDVEDWYKVTTMAQGLDIELYGFEFDCDLYLFSETDSITLVDGSTIIGDTLEEWIYNDTLEAGTYYIGVSIFDPSVSETDTTYYALDLYGLFEPEESGKVSSYNIYRSTMPDARQTGRLITNVNASANSFQDTPPTKQMYYYQVTAVYEQGESEPSNEASALITRFLENDEAKIPDDFQLMQNYPNPFNPSTIIEYSIPKQFDQSVVNLTVYDLSGRKIISLIHEKQTPGFHQVKWNGLNDMGQKLSSGMYIYRLQIGSFSEIRKMILLK